jgi:hypothetical protein
LTSGSECGCRPGGMQESCQVGRKKCLTSPTRSGTLALRASPNENASHSHLRPDCRYARIVPAAPMTALSFPGARGRLYPIRIDPIDLSRGLWGQIPGLAPGSLALGLAGGNYPESDSLARFAAEFEPIAGAAVRGDRFHISEAELLYAASGFAPADLVLSANRYAFRTRLNNAFSVFRHFMLLSKSRIFFLPQFLPACN